MVIYQFWYDYVKLKFEEKVKLCLYGYRHFIAYIKTDDIYKDISKGIEVRFDTSSYELDRPSPKGKNKK